MSLRVYNTLSRNKELFEPVRPGKVGMYLCGPTVYKSPHIGHMVGPVIFDAVKRYLKFKGFDVTWVVNITDVDDKIIAAAAEQGVTMPQLAEKYAAEYFKALAGLGIDTIDKFPKASDHIGEIVDMTKKLTDKGFAYAADGNVWFDVARDADYGKLSGRRLQDQESGTRELEGSGKRNPADFALWKAAKPGEPSWDSPWGKGRPGWHIECSAMSSKYLGDTFDIHGGGDDLKFPHHENELAQSECCTGKPFARYWLHNGLTTFNTKKISGSDLVKDTDEARKMREMLNFTGLLEKLGCELIRYLILSTHYRRPINFGDDVIDSARKGLASFHRLLERAGRLGVKLDDPQAQDVDQASRTLLDVQPVESFIRTLLGLKMKWLEMMDDDFNTAGAIAVMHEIVTATNGFIDASRAESTREANVVAAVASAVATLKKLGALFGLHFTASKTIVSISDELTPKLMELLIALRKEAREAKNFALADGIRKRLTDIGVTLEDNKDGTIWRKG
ncbi:MAG: cysteine--tRNA ligase [Tepidisphaeraceae bacterium]